MYSQKSKVTNAKYLVTFFDVGSEISYWIQLKRKLLVQRKTKIPFGMICKAKKFVLVVKNHFFQCLGTQFNTTIIWKCVLWFSVKLKTAFPEEFVRWELLFIINQTNNVMQIMISLKSNSIVPFSSVPRRMNNGNAYIVNYDWQAVHSVNRLTAPLHTPINQFGIKVIVIRTGGINWTRYGNWTSKCN